MMVRKLVIYLYPLSSLLDVTMELLLMSTWSFPCCRLPPYLVGIKPPYMGNCSRTQLHTCTSASPLHS